MAPNMGRGITAPANDGNIKTGAAEMQLLGSTAATAIDDLEAVTVGELAGKASTSYVDAGLEDASSYTSTVESASLARDDALAADIAGMEGMTYIGAWEPGRVYRINDVVAHGGDSWARLTAGSTGEPGVDPAAWGVVARRGEGGGFGELSETAVTGLYDTVPASGPGYDSGDLDITSSLPGVESGSVVLTRIGWTVWLDFQDVTLTSPGSYVQWDNGTIPTGYRSARHSYTDLPLQGRGSSDTAGPVRVNKYGGITIYAPSGIIRGLVSWFTRQPPPA